MTTIVNHLSFLTNTVGTGPVTSAGPASTGYLDLPSVTPGTSIAYGIVDGTNWEYGAGLCNGTTMSRTPSTSSNSNAAINLSGNSAVVFSGVVGSQVPNLIGSNSFTGGSNAFSGGVGVTGGLSADSFSASAGETITGGSTISGGATIDNLTVSGTLSTGGVQLIVGATGSATPSVNAPKGSLFLNTTASTTTSRMFISTTSGTTTWARFTTNI